MATIYEQLEALLSNAPDIKRVSVKRPNPLHNKRTPQGMREPEYITVKRYPDYMDVPAHVVVQDATTRLKFIPTRSTIQKLMATYRMRKTK